MSIIRFMNHIFGLEGLSQSASYTFYGFIGFAFSAIIAMHLIEYRKRTSFNNAPITVVCEVGSAWSAIGLAVFTAINFFHAVH